MRLLFVHNYYQQPGGEDDVFEAERELLASHGHEVFQHVRHNNEIAGYGPVSMLALGPRTIWARDSRRSFSDLLRRLAPDLVHFHNTFPLISPSAYYACARAGVPVVQSLHNPRLACPAATFHRNGGACQECLGRNFAWPGVMHGCYRHSRVQTSVVAAMLFTHRCLGTWQTKVTRYIVFTEFYRRTFAEAGLPEERISIKPHFIPYDPGVSAGPGEYALYVGRLAEEKGLLTLLNAWDRLRIPVPLKIRGDGPLLEQARGFSARAPHVQVLPRLDRSSYYELVHGARFLVWPSGGYYETFGRVAIEAFACGVPVLASGIGVNAQLVEDRKTGLHVRSGDPEDLAAKVGWAWMHPDDLSAMRRNARAEYEAKYTAETNYRLLMQIYETALGAQPRSAVARAG